MDQATIMHMANELYQARQNKSGLAQWSESIAEFSTQSAYAALWEGIGLREADGEKIIALKMGLTSRAKREQMNLDSPLYGVMTDVMKIENGGDFFLSKTIHPKVEPEIAFRIAKDICSPLSNEKEAYACIDAVAPALEILDSRYTQFKYFSLQDVVADNSSSSHFITGKWNTNYKDLILKDIKLSMSIENGSCQSGELSSINGDPIISLIQLSELLALRNYPIKKGTIVLAGAATAAIALTKGMRVKLEMEHMEALHFSVEP